MKGSYRLNIPIAPANRSPDTLINPTNRIAQVLCVLFLVAMTVVYETVQGCPSCCPTWCRAEFCSERLKAHRFGVQPQRTQEYKSVFRFLMSDESGKLRER